MKLIIRTALLTLLGVAALAPEARADGWISPFAGVNFGGDAGGKFKDVANDPDHLTWGADIGGMLGGIFGAEVDIAYTRNFFGNADAASGNKVVTVVPTAIIGVPIGGQHGAGIRPYLTAGVGWMKRDLTVDDLKIFDDNSAVYSLGAGVMGYFTDHFGMRVDYRYFRNFSADNFDSITDFTIDKGTFNFSRASVGAVFRF